MADTAIALARQGFVVILQDCRGTGDSEPDTWDYFIYEPEDSWDLVEWIRNQRWYDGFIGSCGSSYLGSTQWCMAAHPQMTTIVPQVAGLCVRFNTAGLHMFVSAYARSSAKEGALVASRPDMERSLLKETLSTGYYNAPIQLPLEARRALWRSCCRLPPAERVKLLRKALGVVEFDYVAMASLRSGFGCHVAVGDHSIPAPSAAELARMIRAIPLIIAGWYDWNLNDCLATWELLTSEAQDAVRSGCRLIIHPAAHNVAGYHEGAADSRELARSFRTTEIIDLLALWYDAVRRGATESWPSVIYYLMGANEWRVAADWPPPDAKPKSFYLGSGGQLTTEPPRQASQPDSYTYDPRDPTPTVGGSIVSYVYPPGSVDVSGVQQRADVLVYTTPPLKQDLDVAGPLRMILYASSSAVDTDFVARLSDVFPDGRAIQIQSGILRARYRNPDGEPELLEPGRVYRLEIDMWATANRFKAGHRLRVDISSADFPHFDRNSNRAGEGDPTPARQTIYRDAEHPSHLVVSAVQPTLPKTKDLSARAQALLRTAIVWDNHGCMPLRADASFLPQLERYRGSGVNIVSLNVGFAEMTWMEHLKVLSFMRQWIAHRPDKYRLVSTVDDIRRSKKEGKLGVFFDIEGMCPVQDELSLVQTFYELGVRWMLIAYNKNNKAGAGCLEADEGLTKVGRAIIDEMERVGMVLCLSHTGKRTAAEALDYARNPVIFSHSNPEAFNTHPRNISDDLMRACARKGGVIGINGIGKFLGATQDNIVEQFIKHLRYAIDLVGPDHVGLGLDYVFDQEELKEFYRKNPGLFPPGLSNAGGGLAMVEPEAMGPIVEDLARSNLTDAQIRGILGENWLRVASQVWR